MAVKHLPLPNLAALQPFRSFLFLKLISGGSLEQPKQFVLTIDAKISVADVPVGAIRKLAERLVE